MKRRNRKLRKALLMTCCALALVAISVGATLAYLTDTEAVTNVFTVGKVDISLDETKTDVNGIPIYPSSSAEPERTNEGNEYHLIPGESYTKDPTVHVAANSEPSWLFVKVENGIAAIEESGDTTIANKMEENGWTKLENVENVYYQAHTNKSDVVEDYLVFDGFIIDGDKVTNEILDDYENAEIKVTAYAIQLEGFNDSEKTDDENAAAAWEAGKFN